MQRNSTVISSELRPIKTLMFSVLRETKNPSLGGVLNLIYPTMSL